MPPNRVFEFAEALNYIPEDVIFYRECPQTFLTTNLVIVFELFGFFKNCLGKTTNAMTKNLFYRRLQLNICTEIFVCIIYLTTLVPKPAIFAPSISFMDKLN